MGHILFRRDSGRGYRLRSRFTITVLCVKIGPMLDITAVAAVLLTVWIVVLVWQVARGSVPARIVHRLSGNPELITGYFRAAKVVMVGSLALIIPASLMLVLYLVNSPGVTFWLVWVLAALVPSGFLVSRRLALTASAAEKGRAVVQSQTK